MAFTTPRYCCRISRESDDVPLIGYRLDANTSPDSDRHVARFRVRMLQPSLQFYYAHWGLRWILLFMQNGEFLQMTVTFSALAARFRHLNVELRPLARMMHEDIRLVLVALYVCASFSVRARNIDADNVKSLGKRRGYDL